MIKNTQERFGAIAKGFHWLLAIVILGLLPLGFFMVTLSNSDPFKLDLYWWHKSFGTLVLMLVALRLIWRFANRQPDHILSHKKWERTLAAIIHVLLYVGMFLMPLSGWVMSSAGDFTHSFFGLFDLPHIAPKNEALMHAAGTVHKIGAFSLIAAIGLHGAGAFKHHFLDRDATLLRILPVAWPRLGAVLSLIVFIGLLGTAFLLGTYKEFFRPETPQASREESVLKVETIDSFQAPAAQRYNWVIVQEQSEIAFSVAVQGDPFKGRFNDFSGDIYFDPANLADSAVNMSVNTASVQTGSKERDTTIALPIWLASSSFPQARFKAGTFEQTGENRYIASGQLTLRGVTKPLSVPFTLVIEERDDGGKTARMEGSFTVPRLDFGIGQKEWADPGMVAHSVIVDVSLTAISSR